MKQIILLLVIASTNLYSQFISIEGLTLGTNIIVFPHPQNLDANMSLDGAIGLAGNFFLGGKIKGRSYLIRSFGEKKLSDYNIEGNLAYAIVNEDAGAGGTVLAAGPTYGLRNLTDGEFDFFEDSFKELGLRTFFVHQNYSEITSSVSASIRRTLKDIDLTTLSLYAHQCVSENIGISIQACHYFGENNAEDISRRHFKFSLFYKNNEGAPFMAGFTFSGLDYEINHELHKARYPGFFVAVGLKPGIK